MATAMRTGVTIEAFAAEAAAAPERLRGIVLDAAEPGGTFDPAEAREVLAATGTTVEQFVGLVTVTRQRGELAKAVEAGEDAKVELASARQFSPELGRLRLLVEAGEAAATRLRQTAPREIHDRLAKIEQTRESIARQRKDAESELRINQQRLLDAKRRLGEIHQRHASKAADDVTSCERTVAEWESRVQAIADRQAAANAEMVELQESMLEVWPAGCAAPGFRC